MGNYVGPYITHARVEGLRLKDRFARMYLQTYSSQDHPHTILNASAFYLYVCVIVVPFGRLVLCSRFVALGDVEGFWHRRAGMQ